MKLHDRVALVTGGAGGLGRAIALRLAGEGARVVICDINDAALEATHTELAERGVPCLALRCVAMSRRVVR